MSSSPRGAWVTRGNFANNHFMPEGRGLTLCGWAAGTGPFHASVESKTLCPACVREYEHRYKRKVPEIRENAAIAPLRKALQDAEARLATARAEVRHYNSVIKESEGYLRENMAQEAESQRVIDELHHALSLLGVS